MNDEIKVRVETRLSLEGLEPSNGLIELAGEEVIQKILTYTNLLRIPKTLYPLTSKIIVDLIRNHLQIKEQSGSGGSVIAGYEATAIEVGDTKVNLKKSKSAEEAHSTITNKSLEVDNIMNNYMMELRAFRKVRW